MTADVELLPLPLPEPFVSDLMHGDLYTPEQVRACVAHATAAKDAEIEALRAEVDRWKIAGRQWADKTEWVQQTIKPREWGRHRADILRQRIEQAEARAELLAEALRDVMPFVVTDVLEHCDGNKCREQWCAGCSGDAEAEEAVARSAKAAGVAYALLREQEADRE